jgi:SAM-dependent methyltransferase
MKMPRSTLHWISRVVASFRPSYAANHGGLPPPLSVDARIYSRRFELTSDLLVGCGLEIGAGVNPQKLPDEVSCVYFDKRDAQSIKDLFHDIADYEVHPIDEIPTFFPDGADFLIAHNVLEHSPDPIGLLRSWFSFVRNDGMLVLSLPEKSHCPPDAMRAVPSLDHLVLDHVYSRGEDTFESKEHIYSFLLGWRDHVHPHLNKVAYCDHCLAEAQRSGHDLHWHAIDLPLGEKVIQTAGLLSGKDIDMVRICHSASETFSTFGEVIYIFRLRRLTQMAASYVDRVLPEIQRIADSLNSGGQSLSDAIHSWSRDGH